MSRPGFEGLAGRLPLDFLGSPHLSEAARTSIGLTLYTRNPSDLEGLDRILDIEEV